MTKKKDKPELHIRGPDPSAELEYPIRQRPAVMTMFGLPDDDFDDVDEFGYPAGIPNPDLTPAEPHHPTDDDLIYLDWNGRSARYIDVYGPAPPCPPPDPSARGASCRGRGRLPPPPETKPPKPKVSGYRFPYTPTLEEQRYAGPDTYAVSVRGVTRPLMNPKRAGLVSRFDERSVSSGEPVVVASSCPTRGSRGFGSSFGRNPYDYDRSFNSSRGTPNSGNFSSSRGTFNASRGTGSSSAGRPRHNSGPRGFGNSYDTGRSRRGSTVYGTSAASSSFVHNNSGSGSRSSMGTYDPGHIQNVQDFRPVDRTPSTGFNSSTRARGHGVRILQPGAPKIFVENAETQKSAEEAQKASQKAQEPAEEAQKTAEEAQESADLKNVPVPEQEFDELTEVVAASEEAEAAPENLQPVIEREEEDQETPEPLAEAEAIQAVQLPPLADAVITSEDVESGETSSSGGVSEAADSSSYVGDTTESSSLSHNNSGSGNWSSIGTYERGLRILQSAAPKISVENNPLPVDDRKEEEVQKPSFAAKPDEASELLPQVGAEEAQPADLKNVPFPEQEFDELTEVVAASEEAEAAPENLQPVIEREEEDQETPEPLAEAEAVQAVQLPRLADAVITSEDVESGEASSSGEVSEASDSLFSDGDTAEMLQRILVDLGALKRDILGYATGCV
ncbi:hypothetical protein L596_012071 [Steinernema carpocapsae]|uniref:Uncharacterized protein n=1 Tax=Steinernema carpocapsae TaxID=34508 RepID=A0A4U5NWU6_STECR|nr:hypothetical protein L596_012071 [Steinernema carpocapsae]